MRSVGIYRELGGHNGAPSVFDEVEILPEALYLSVLHHLKCNGFVVWDQMSDPVNPFEPDKLIVGGDSILSDGYWGWTQSIVYCFEFHNLCLDADFLEHVEDYHHKPHMTADEVTDLLFSMRRRKPIAFSDDG